MAADAVDENQLRALLEQMSRQRAAKTQSIVARH
jgi:hypothetical protein